MRTTNRSGTVGRVLRLLLGLFLVASAWPFWRAAGPGFLGRAVLVLAALAVFYILLGAVLNRRGPLQRPFRVACLALVPLGLVYGLGMGGGPIFGAGEGQLAALTYLGASLLLAAFAADRGCEVLTIPRLLFRNQVPLPCIVFHMSDRLEDKLARRDGRSGGDAGGS